MSGFAVELRRASAAVGVVPRLVADSPQEWRLGPLTVVDGGRGAAALRYARLPAGRARWEPEAIVKAWRRVVDQLRRRSLAPELFLPILNDAYGKTLAKEGRRDGDRVPITGVRDAACATRHTPRVQFSWDVARLRHEHRLAFAGRRLDLGVATGLPARGKLIWLEDAAGGGQYYQTFRFAP